MRTSKEVKRTHKDMHAPKKETPHIIAYRMKCARTANGLTHFVMYGDVPKQQMPL